MAPPTTTTAPPSGRCTSSTIKCSGAASSNGVGTFGPCYMDRQGNLATLSGTTLTYGAFLASISATTATSASGAGTRTGSSISAKELTALYPLEASDLKTYLAAKAANKLATGAIDVEAAINQIAAALNQAWRIFMIDTVEGRSGLLGNAVVESQQCRFLTETTIFTGGPPYQPDPTKAKLDKGYLNGCMTGTDPNTKRAVTGYQTGGEVNPLANNNNWVDSFIGRGAIQVTNRTNYLRTLAVMDRRLIELSDPKHANPASTDADDAKLLTDAITAIKDAPVQAANPLYAYLFSCAMMKQPNVNGDVKSSQGDIFSWMGAGQPEKDAKTKSFTKAKTILGALGNSSTDDS